MSGPVRRGIKEVHRGVLALAVAYHGPINQALQCDATQAPTSTTGGVLDPAGGIYLTVGG